MTDPSTPAPDRQPAPSPPQTAPGPPGPGQPPARRRPQAGPGSPGSDRPPIPPSGQPGPGSPGSGRPLDSTGEELPGSGPAQLPARAEHSSSGPAQLPGRAGHSGPDPRELPGRAEHPDPDPTGRGPAGAAGAEGFEGDPTAWPPDEAVDAVDLDDRGWTRRDLEAILLVADEPVPAAVLAEVVGSRLSEVEELLVDLAGEYARDGRGFVLRAVAGGWRLYTHPGARTAVEAFLRAGQQSRLTRAALETLAVVAYRQPVTRFQVAAVRGVNVDGVFRTLASRGLIHEVGTDPGPGQAVLYGTTPAFLEQLGLNDLDQLPPIKDYLPEGVDLLDLQEQP
jgi:segregation and condensation protein B